MRPWESGSDTREKIIRKLREAEKLQAEGLRIAQVFQRLAEENRRLKKLVADQALDIACYKEIATGNW